jgi:DnaJ-class molecular chaperone
MENKDKDCSRCGGSGRTEEMTYPGDSSLSPYGFLTPRISICGQCSGTGKDNTPSEEK